MVGLFTLDDLKRALAVDRGGARLSEVISKILELAHPDQTLDVAMIKLGRKGVSQLPVVSRKDASKLLGIIILHDIAEPYPKRMTQAPQQTTTGRKLTGKSFPLRPWRPPDPGRIPLLRLSLLTLVWRNLEGGN